jgi:RNA polymerase-binding transcription factor DksA
MRLLRKMEEQSLWRAHRLDVAFTATGPPDDGRSLDRAMAALNAYCARASLEEIQSAFARIELGAYGVCPRCQAPISAEHFEVSPETKYCADCDGKGDHHGR